MESQRAVELVKFGPELPIIWPRLVDIGLNVANWGQSSAHVAPSWPDVGHVLPLVRGTPTQRFARVVDE